MNFLEIGEVIGRSIHHRLYHREEIPIMI